MNLSFSSAKIQILNIDLKRNKNRFENNVRSFIGVGVPTENIILSDSTETTLEHIQNI